MKKIVGSLGAISVVLLTLALALPVYAEDNPFIGTWKLNLEKSKFDPGPAVMSRVVRIEAAGDAVKFSVDQVDADGKHATVVETPKLDGKDYPRRGTGGIGPNFADTIAFRRIDTYTMEETLKKAGKVVAAIRQVVSNDSKTRTATQIMGTNARGQAVHDVLVFDKL